MQAEPTLIRNEAQLLADGFPELLAKAHHLAASMALGQHGRRRAGVGDQFWQFRQAVTGDHYRDIDWRRSARSDEEFIRQMEWQSAQVVSLWIDTSASMDFATQGQDSKRMRASVLGLALCILLSQAGERFALMEDPEPARSGGVQISRTALIMANATDQADYGVVPRKEIPKGSRAVFISDFLGEWDKLVETISEAADQQVDGCLVQVLDPAELAFPFSGRTIFESMQGVLRFETMRANALKEDYLARLAERKDQLALLAKQTGWHVMSHVTDRPAHEALLWLHTHLEAR